MLLPLRFIAGVRPDDWRAAEATLLRHRALAPRNALPMMGLSLLVVLFELSGVFSLLPLLQFVQAEQSLPALVEKSPYWRRAAELAATIGVPITLVTLAFVTVLLLISRQVVFYLSTRTGALVRERFARDIRLSATRRLFEARPSTIRGVGSGSFVVLVNQQATNGSAMVAYFSEAFQITLTFAAFAIGIAFVSPWVIVLGGACAVIVVIVLSVFVRGTYRINTELARDYDQFGQFLAQFYNAWRLVKLTNRIDPLMAELESRTERIRLAQMGLVRHSGLIQLLAMPMAAVLGLGSLVILTGVVALNVAQLTLMIVVLFRLGPMAEGLVKLRNSMTGGITALRRIEDLHVAAVANREVDDGTLAFHAPRERISFRGVHFSYPERDAEALSGIDLDIPAHLLTAVIGPSGAGKSTLIDLLARIDTPNAGQISIDDTPITDFRLGALRRGIAVVDQSAVLIAGTIADNLRLVNPQANEREMMGALEFASAAEFVRRLPDGLATTVGENGAQLSGGQRQRLTIARAILGEAQIVVFDEPTSALDFESETAFRNSLDALVARRDRTIILIAHRFSTIQNADYVVILKDGKVEEAARPADLTRDFSYYRRMIDAQTSDR